MRKIAVIGYGSIGLRHTQFLKKNYQVNVFSSRSHLNEKNIKFFKNLDNCLDGCSHAFICNYTADHLKFIKKCLKKNIHVYCEKPIHNKIFNLSFFVKNNYFKKNLLYIGFQLRFDEVIIKAKKIASETSKYGRLLHYRGYVGQNLKNWRNNIHYTRSVSYSKEKGGGVLLELIHDIDLANHLLSSFVLINAFSSTSLFKSSDIEDTASINFKTNNGIYGNIFLDMVSPRLRREIQLTFEKCIFIFDIADSKITKISNKKRKVVKLKKNERNKSFLKSHMKFFKESSKVSFLVNNSKILKYNLKLINIINKIKRKYSH